MRPLSLVLAVVAATSLLPVAVDAAPGRAFAFRTFSHAKFVSIGNKLCGPGGNPRACCTFNGGLWRTLPKPHCIFI